MVSLLILLNNIYYTRMYTIHQNSDNGVTANILNNIYYTGMYTIHRNSDNGVTSNILNNIPRKPTSKTITLTLLLLSS